MPQLGTCYDYGQGPGQGDQRQTYTAPLKAPAEVWQASCLLSTGGSKSRSQLYRWGGGVSSSYEDILKVTRQREVMRNPIRIRDLLAPLLWIVF